MTHRFINADGLVSTGTGILGHNMFAYCDNNPVNCKDVTGSKTIREIQMDIANGDTTYNILQVTIMQMAEQEGAFDRIYGHDKNNMLSEYTSYHSLNSASDVYYYYNEMSYDDYAKFYEYTSVINFIDFGWIKYIADLSKFDYINTVPTDSYGNELYLEYGYLVVKISRVYYWDRESHTKNQYVVFDRNGRCVFNKTIQETYFSD